MNVVKGVQVHNVQIDSEILARSVRLKEGAGGSSLFVAVHPTESITRLSRVSGATPTTATMQNSSLVVERSPRSRGGIRWSRVRRSERGVHCSGEG